MGNQSHISQLAHPALTLVPAWARPAGVAKLHLNDISPDHKKKAKGLIYAGEFYGTTVYGYPNPDNTNKPASCTLTGLADVNGFSADAKGNTAIPAYVSGTYLSVNVFAPNCGKLLWSATDSAGQPADSFGTNDTAQVLVGEIANYTTGGGAVLICSKASGCGTPNAPSGIGYGAGVAMAKNGDCWLSAENASFSAFELFYFKGCKGTGQVATGTSNAYYGGLFIDTKGNLGSFSYADSKLYVYKGCAPACTLVSSSTLHGESLFGGLDKKGKTMAAGDFSNGSVDVYKYSSSGVTYQYSITNGLSSSLDVEAGIPAPSNKKI